MNEGYVIYYPDEPDFAFYRSALSTVMMVSQRIRDDYGKWAERVVFRGGLARTIYDFFMEKKYNVGATMHYEDSPYDLIVMELANKVKVRRGDVIRDFGFEYTIEKDEKPQIEIQIVKLF